MNTGCETDEMFSGEILETNDINMLKILLIVVLA